MKLLLQNKLLRIVILLLLIFAAGTIGYWVIEGQAQGMTPFDAFYMTVITLTTIGFGEIPGELSLPGRVLTVFLAFGGMGTMLYAVSTITAFLVEGQLRDLIRRRKMNKRIEKLSGHYVLCGSGLIARYIANELKSTRNHFVAVDTDKDALDKLAGDDPEINYVVGDVSDDAVLIDCGIERARGLISALPSDQDNIFTIITARRLNPGLRIVSVAVAEQSIAKLRYAGADGVVSPNFIGSMRMVSEMIRPAAVGFLDMMLKDKGGGHWRIEEARIEAGCRICGRALGEAMLKEKAGVLVLGIRKPGSKDYIYNPPRDIQLEGDDTLVVLGSQEQVAALKAMVGGK
ncbi:MAG TPA: NAD-binding protein [Acidobacteriota bacterium]|nr:NAD-binding protein [Acidobacteriota bacterium]